MLVYRYACLHMFTNLGVPFTCFTNVLNLCDVCAKILNWGPEIHPESGPNPNKLDLPTTIVWGIGPKYSPCDKVDCRSRMDCWIEWIFFDILKALRIIILKEKGNSILVNVSIVSVGSKIQAIASMMACMMFKDIAMIKPYYAVPERYTSSLAEEERQGDRRS